MMKHRIFVSIGVPEELKNVAEAHIEPFYKNKLARVVERENWHITVVFCGYLTDEELEKLKDSAIKTSQETKKFELVPDKIIFKNNRMVWLTFKYSQEFSRLTKLFSEFNQGKREQNLHITLVRFKEFHYPNLKNLLPKDGINIKNETVAVKHINIMESHLNRHGPKYELIEKINLQ